MNLGTTIDIDQITNTGLSLDFVIKHLSNLPINPIRVGIRWNKVQSKRKRYSWTGYDRLLGELSDNGKEIILSIGMKSPRWPEFHIPDWALERYDFKQKHTFSKTDVVLYKYLSEFIQSALERYKRRNAIVAIQVENEPLFRFGPNRWKIDIALLKQEIDIVKKTVNFPVLISSPGLPTTGLLAEFLKGRFGQKRALSVTDEIDIIGFNIFPRFESRQWGRAQIFEASSLAWKYLSYWTKTFTSSGKKVWISELQAEPWQMEKVNFKDAYANKTCDPDKVMRYIKRVEKMGIDTVLLWGTEFHLACMQQGNAEWIQKLYP